jgi:hypothetical protein
MSWWQQFLSGIRRPNRAEQTVETVSVVQDKLQVTVYSHDIESQLGPIPCWSYLTSGLWTVGHRELIFTLRREDNRNFKTFPKEPLDILPTILRLAEEGRTVNVGDLSEFRPPGLLGFLGWG